MNSLLKIIALTIVSFVVLSSSGSITPAFATEASTLPYENPSANTLPYERPSASTQPVMPETSETEIKEDSKVDTSGLVIGEGATHSADRTKKLASKKAKKNKRHHKKHRNKKNRK